MTHRLHAQTTSHLPIRRPLTYRTIKFYSLFKLNGKSWVRDSPNAYSENVVYKVFGNRLAENPLIYKIKPCELELGEAR